MLPNPIFVKNNTKFFTLKIVAQKFGQLLPLKKLPNVKNRQIHRRKIAQSGHPDWESILCVIFALFLGWK
jgi:hypothetical protein